MRTDRTAPPDSKLPYLEGWGSIALNCLLFAAKYAVGLASGSVAITADAWHTLSDSITSLLVLAGVKVSRKPADAAHPFGHGRAETVSSLVIGVLLAMVAVFFGGDAVRRLFAGRRAEYGAAAIWVTAVSVVLKEAMARFSSWAGRKTGYTALKADAWHHRSDALSSLVILAGILFGGAFWWVDGVLGLLVSLLILHAAIDIFREVLGPLLGEAPSPELLGRLRDICARESSLPLVPHHVHLHEYGFHTELTFHIRLPGATSLERAHALATGLERAVERELGMTATVHLEPAKAGKGNVSTPGAGN